MSSRWDRPRLNRNGAEHRLRRVREQFGRFGRRRISVSRTFFLLALAFVAVTAVMRSVQEAGSGEPSMRAFSGEHQSSGAYRNCAAARAAGAAPVRRGEEGYAPHLDRDNDGVGCEPYPR